MPVKTEELRLVLSQILRRPVTELCARPYPYQSSFPLEEIDLTLADGQNLQLIFKDVARNSMSLYARRLKPPFLYDPRREIRTYQEVLAPLNLGTPVVYGAVVDEKNNRYWLFLEKVSGVELYQIGDINVWQTVALWLASFHERLQPRAVNLAQTLPLLPCTKEHLLIWIRRIEQLFDNVNTNGNGDLARLSEQYARAVDRITQLPLTFVHGEFYPSNILVDTAAGRMRVCPLDWEMAALAPAVLDLAALTSGRWTDEERRSLAMAYVSGRSRLGQNVEEFLRDLDYSRLIIAVQWLGWFGHKEAHWQHRYDWLAEAFRLTGRVAEF